MAFKEISVDLVLNRPENVSPARWMEVLIDACCRRSIPNLHSFTIGAETCHLAMPAPNACPGGGLSLNLDAVAAIYADLAEPPRRAGAARLLVPHEMTCSARPGAEASM
jgi:hypothetical protein